MHGAGEHEAGRGPRIGRRLRAKVVGVDPVRNQLDYRLRHPCEHPGTLGLGDADDTVEGADRLLFPEPVEHAVPGRGEAPIQPEAKVAFTLKAQRFNVMQ